MQAREMISTHPDVRGDVNDALVRCIEQCYSCAQTCIACADACLAERSVQQLRQCIRLNNDCADICTAAGALASRRAGSNELVLKRMLELCAEICRICGVECEQHADHHEHCRVCAAQCRDCQRACEEAAATITIKTTFNA